MSGEARKPIFLKMVMGIQVFVLVLMLGVLPAHAEDEDRMYFDYESDTLLTEGNHDTDGASDSGGWLQGAWDWLTAAGSDVIDYTGDFFSNLFSDIGDFFSSLWDSLPDAIQGLLKGLVAAVIAVVVLALVAVLIGLTWKFILIGAALALLAGAIYGLIVGGENFDWGHAMLIASAAFLAGVGAVYLAGTGAAALIGQAVKGFGAALVGVLRGIGPAVMGVIRSLPTIIAGLSRGIATIASTYWGFLVKGAGAAWASMKWGAAGAWGWLKGTAVGGWLAAAWGAFAKTTIGGWIIASYAAVGFKNLMIVNTFAATLLTVISGDISFSTFFKNFIFGLTAPLFGGAYTAFRATSSLLRKSGIWAGTSLFGGGLYTLANGEFTLETFIAATLITGALFFIGGPIASRINNPFAVGVISAAEDRTKKWLISNLIPKVVQGGKFASSKFNLMVKFGVESSIRSINFRNEMYRRIIKLYIK